MEIKRLIKITGNKVFLTPEMCLNLSQTSLGGKYLSFKSIQDIYFEVEILSYDKINKELKIRVIDYKPKNIAKFKEQVPKDQVAFIVFEPLKWTLIEPHLLSYTKGKLIKEDIIIDDEMPKESYPSRRSILDELKAKYGDATVSLEPLHNELTYDFSNFKNQKPIIEVIKEEAKILFKDADFNLGFVAFIYKSKRLNKSYNLKIENHFLLPQFNAIKSYFPKAFGGKKHFSIIITFTLTDNDVTDIVTTSSEIQGINENIIDCIKHERIARLTSTPLIKSVDKSFFTAEDIFDNFENNLKDGNVFNETEEDILNFLIKTRNVRNAKHLQFLAGSKHSANQKLRFTLKPKFGFLFFIEGETKNHFCWELLDSNATYLWSFEKFKTDIKFQLKRVEMTVNTIRDMGRDPYKTNYKANKIDNDLIFCTIEHSNINSAFIEGFVEWQHRLKERLV